VHLCAVPFHTKLKESREIVNAKQKENSWRSRGEENRLIEYVNSGFMILILAKRQFFQKINISNTPNLYDLAVIHGVLRECGDGV